jgi:YgjP-like, metallopeptidase domain
LRSARPGRAQDAARFRSVQPLQRSLEAEAAPGADDPLSFNWRLVLTPFAVIDYVVMHELCHLRVPNHSRSFWTLVERQRPHWREQRAWLHDHGPELLAFRPSD